MSQSAVSDALSRLRELFQDRLLIPSGRGFVLSPKAMELEPILLGSLHQIEALLSTRTFDPREASGRFQIAASDYASLLIGPPLARRLIEEAPDVCLQFHDVDDESFTALANGQLDLMIIPESTRISPELALERLFLFEDELVFVRSADYTGDYAADQEWGAADAPFYAFGDQPDVFRPAICQRFGEQDLETVVLPAFMLLPFFVENTGITAVAQRRLVERLLPAAKIEILDTRNTFSKIRLFVVWARARNPDPLHRWLRELVVDLGADLMVEDDRYA